MARSKVFRTMGPVLAILLIACGSGAGSDIGLRDQAVDALDAAYK